MTVNRRITLVGTIAVLSMAAVLHATYLRAYRQGHEEAWQEIRSTYEGKPFTKQETALLLRRGMVEVRPIPAITMLPTQFIDLGKSAK